MPYMLDCVQAEIQTRKHVLQSPALSSVGRAVARFAILKDIAALLNISVKPVESHRQQITDKLDLRSVEDMTKYAAREG
jgi:DNA-binding CsgD family transcriptional regulator